MNRFFDKQRVSVLIVAFVVLGILSACKHSPEERLDKGVSRITKDLNITPDQKNEIDQYKKEGVADLREMKKGRLNILTEIENELTTGKSDPERIKQLYHEQSVKRDELMNKWIEKLAHFQETLSPDQKHQLLVKVKKIKEGIEETK
jgi:Spy/CpxP family protein refolding chaperone